MKRVSSLHPLLRLCVLVAVVFAAIGQSQQLRIHSLDWKNSILSFAVDGTSSSYFIVHRAPKPDGPWTPVFMDLAVEGANAFTFTATNSAAFFRVEEVPRSRPKDTDGDGLDDLCELLHRPIFDPLVPQSPSGDYDKDGIPDIQECGNNWNPLNPNSPTPEEFFKKRGLVGSVIVGPIISSDQGENVGDVGQILSGVSISSSGTCVFISAKQTGPERTNYMVHKFKFKTDGTVTRQILAQQEDIYGLIAFGPNIEINQNDEVLVRRVVVVPFPVFGNVLYTFLTKYDAFGQPVDLVTGASLRTFAEFSDIQREYCMNNLGDFATAASDWNIGRVIASATSEFAAKTPLAETTPFSPMQCSDARTLVIRTGDANGRIRLFGMPDLGNKPIFSASSANGFSDLGKRPGISYDGRMVVFYANYSGSGSFPNLTPGPGIFALVHTDPISIANVSAAKLVRIAGRSGNGQLEPGERWEDANTNGVVDAGEDMGRITSFVPDAQVSGANDGKVIFHCWTTEKEGNGLGTSLESIACTKLFSFALPTAGRISVPIRSGETLADGQQFANIGLSSTMDRGGGNHFSALTLGRTGGERMFIVELPPMDLAVDADRDGTISLGSSEDTTSDKKPFSFWLNTDTDRSHTVDGNDSEEDDIGGAELGSTRTDAEEDRIQSKRDLEDYARLWLQTQGLFQAFKEEGNPLFLGLQWTDTGATTPAIKLVKHVETDGAASYLTDETTADIQLAAGSAVQSVPGVNPSSTLVDANESNGRFFVLPKSLFGGLSEATPNTYLLFEGAQEGKGQLRLVILKKSGSSFSKIGDGPGVWLNLRKIEDFYERWTVGDGNGGPPSILAERQKATLNAAGDNSGYSEGFKYATDALEENKYILYVHGWNMQAWEKNRYAETMFKRLYWLGYKGRLGSFCWPTTYGFEGLKSAILNGTSYDKGEWAAWRSAVPLSTLVTDLNDRYGNQVYVMAHSMGNVVAGEAFRIAAQKSLGRLVNTYIASQAAVPAHVYDGLRPQDIMPAFDIPRRIVDGDAVLPNVYQDWLSVNRSTVGRRVNFYNINDYALWNDVWELNQAFKPDQEPHRYTYLDDIALPPTQTGFAWFRTDDSHDPSDRILWSADRSTFWILATLKLGSSSDVMDRYEIMSFASESRTKALGAISQVPFFENVDLQSIWPPDTGLKKLDLSGEYPDGLHYSAHKWHSAQFRSTNMRQSIYWQALLGPTGFRIGTAP